MGGWVLRVNPPLSAEQIRFHGTYRQEGDLTEYGGSSKIDFPLMNGRSQTGTNWLLKPVEFGSSAVLFLLHMVIYTIIPLKSVCLSAFANCRSQFLLDLLGRCLGLSVSAESISCHEFAFQFGLAIFYTRKTSTISGKSGG